MAAGTAPSPPTSLTASGLEVPAFSPPLAARIEPQLERAGSIGNPVDIIDGADGLASFTGIARAVPRVGRGRRA